MIFSWSWNNIKAWGGEHCFVLSPCAPKWDGDTQDPRYAEVPYYSVSEIKEIKDRCGGHGFRKQECGYVKKTDVHNMMSKETSLSEFLMHITEKLPPEDIGDYSHFPEEVGIFLH